MKRSTNSVIFNPMIMKSAYSIQQSCMIVHVSYYQVRSHISCLSAYLAEKAHRAFGLNLRCISNFNLMQIMPSKLPIIVILPSAYVPQYGKNTVVNLLRSC